MNRDDLTRVLFKGGSILFAGLLIDLSISFIGKLLIARYLGRVDYGAVSLGSSFLSFSSVFLLMGLHIGVGRYLPRFDPETESTKRQTVIETAVILTLPSTIIISIFTFMRRDWVASTVFQSPDASGVLGVFALGLPLSVAYRHALAVIRGYQWSVPKAVLQNILRPTVRLSGIAVGIWLSLDAVGMSIAYIIPFGIALVASFYWVRRTVAFDRFRGQFCLPEMNSHRRIAWNLLSFSAPLIITTVMISILTDIDRFFLSYYHSTGAVGIYSVIYPLGELVTMGIRAFGFIFMPVLSELHSKEEMGEMRRIYQVVTKWLFFVTLPVGAVLILIPQFIIGITFGAEYTAGATALSVLAVGFFSHAIVGLNGAALTSVGRTRTLAIINVATAILNVTLNLLLIPSYSFLGAAVATTISYILMNLSYTAVLYKTTGIHPFSQAYIRPSIPLLGLTTIIYLSLSRIMNVTWEWLLIYTVFGGILYLGIIVQFGGIQQEEIIIIESIEERFGIPLTSLKQILRRYDR